MTILNRFLYYLLLAGLCLTVPYILTMLFIIFTGDRYTGMYNAVLPGLLISQLLFGFIFIKKNLIRKIILSIIVSIIALGFVWAILKIDLIKTTLDIYRFLDLAVLNFIAGFITWELFYQIDKRFIAANPEHLL